MDIGAHTLPLMSKKMDSGDFGERLLKAAKHAGVVYSQQALGTFLGTDRRKVDVWMKGGLPRADTLFDMADKFGVDPRWFATGEGDPVRKPAAPGGELEAHEADLIGRYRSAEPRWRLALQLLASVAVDDQIEAATDVNMVMARIFGKRPRELRPVGDSKMREILKKSPQGWPPREKAKEGK